MFGMIVGQFSPEKKLQRNFDLLRLMLSFVLFYSLLNFETKIVEMLQKMYLFLFG